MTGCYAYQAMVEPCAPDKGKIALIASHSAIHFIFSGAGYFNGRRMTAGEGFLHLKNTFGTYYPDPADPWCYGWLSVGGETSARSLAEMGISALTEPPYTFRFSQPEKIRALLESFDHAGNALYRAGMLRLVFACHPCAQTDRPQSQKERLAMQAQNELRIHYARRDCTVAHVAARLGISPSYLRKLYSAAFGVSPQHALMQLRMDRARELLTAGNATVTVVGASCGYDDVLQFSRIFKKHVGLSPQAYRAGAQKPQISGDPPQSHSL